MLLVSESDVCRSVLAAALLRQELQAAGLEGAVRIDTCVSDPQAGPATSMPSKYKLLHALSGRTRCRTAHSTHINDMRQAMVQT